MSKPKLWQPTKLLAKNDESYAVVVLNTPIQNTRNFLYICSNARTIVAADGGANRIFDLDVTEQQRKIITPHAIVGDFDSIRPDVWHSYEAAGLPFKQDPDQYSTDFTKALKYVKASLGQNQKDASTVVFGALGGRPDQSFAQLHQLHMAAQDPDLGSGDLFLYTNEGLLFLLEVGENVIDTSGWPNLITESIGIIPLGKPATISTKGLEWDVTDWHTSFDTQVSTSNHIRAAKVIVTTSERVLFTMEFAAQRY